MVGGGVNARLDDGAASRVRRSAQAALGYRFVRVLLVGATSAAVDFGIFNLLLWLVVDESDAVSVVVANTTSFAVAMVVNYTLNARYSFGAPITRRSALAYVVFTALSLALYNLNLVALRALLGAEDALLLNVSKLLAMAVLVVWNYVGYRYIVFPTREPDGPAPDSALPAARETLSPHE